MAVLNENQLSILKWMENTSLKTNSAIRPIIMLENMPCNIHIVERKYRNLEKKEQFELLKEFSEWGLAQ